MLMAIMAIKKCSYGNEHNLVAFVVLTAFMALTYVN